MSGMHDMFNEHPDLAEADHEQCQADGQLLASLLRELDDEGWELYSHGANPTAMLNGVVTSCAAKALTDTRQDLCARILHRQSNGRLRFTQEEMDILGGYYGEAFMLGMRFIAEKHGWNEFRTQLRKDQAEAKPDLPEVRPEDGPGADG